MKATKALCIGLLGSALGLCSLAASSPAQIAPVFHASMPAGYDVLLLQPAGTVLTFLGLIECPGLEGAQHITDGVNARIVNTDGKSLAYFPDNFSFRITASLRRIVLLDPTATFAISDQPQDLLLKFKFLLKAHHGLQVREIQPESVQLIGVPADIPYDERVYRVSFNVKDLPVTDRCVLEVISPEGVRLTKFHFDLL